VGTVLEGAYRITRLLGEGGMGAVYEAVQLDFKQARGDQADGSRSWPPIARPWRGSTVRPKFTSHLGHPHLVIVFDFGRQNPASPTW